VLPPGQDGFVRPFKPRLDRPDLAGLGREERQKVLNREYARRRREKHPEEVKAYERRWLQSHPEERRHQQHSYYIRHRDEILKRQRQRREQRSKELPDQSAAPAQPGTP
jgi:hypothetical protein